MAKVTSLDGDFVDAVGDSHAGLGAGEGLFGGMVVGEFVLAVDGPVRAQDPPAVGIALGAVVGRRHLHLEGPRAVVSLLGGVDGDDVGEPLVGDLLTTGGPRRSIPLVGAVAACGGQNHQHPDDDAAPSRHDD